MSKQSGLLVVDASVMRSAGSLSKEGLSGLCSRMLQSILFICHRVAMTADIREEWNKHQSEFAKTWRARMVAKRKMILIEPDKSSVVEEIEKKVPPEHTAALDSLLKDAHLLAAARAADHLILTGDRALQELCQKHEILQGGIEWLLLLEQNTDQQNKALEGRLEDLSTTHPNPPLPK